MRLSSKVFVFFAFITMTVFFSIDSGTTVKERKERDSTGTEWILKEWEEGTRPYPKSLNEREKWYREKWGENWYEVKNGGRIYNPGNWEWEIVTTLPSDLAVKIASKFLSGGKPRIWGNRFYGMVFIWAPGGRSITDIYALADNGIYHYDPVNRIGIFIGNPDVSGLRDGDTSYARLQPGKAVTIDPITGRLYFIQDRRWRYVEKLLPYECSAAKKIYYLPAVLDWNNIYRNVKSPFGGDLKPVIKDGRRGKPIFVVRTNTSVNTLHLPGASKGKRPLVRSDGKGVYFSQTMALGKEHDTLTLYDKIALFDIETGKIISKIELQGAAPKNFTSGTDGPGSHGGNCMGYDGSIYTCQHGGAGGGAGRMFSIEPVKGKITMLYDSMADDGTWSKRRGPVIDGPADAKSLNFTSTLWQVQCPRTGAIVNGGWDNMGIRRYHDGFVTTIVGHNYGEFYKPARPGWSTAFRNVHGNSSPSIAPNGDLYIADDNSDIPRILRIYRTDWPKEQPVNGYAEKFLTREKVEALMLEYAMNYIDNFEKKNKLLETSNDK